MILIFSNKQDVHCNPVIRRLAERGEAFLRINTEALLTDYRFAFHVEESGEPYAWIHCVPNGITADTRDVKAIWDRRPSRPDSLPGDGGAEAMDGELRRVALEEGAAFSMWLRYFLGDRFAIGSPAGDPPAESKFLQARVAWGVLEDYGLHGDLSLVPTTVGNDHGRFEPLLRPNRDVAIKPLTADGITAGEGEEYPFLTQRRPASELREAPPSAFAACPTQLQPYVEKAFEARITVVGRRLFPCRIDTSHLSPDQGGTDWRAGYSHGLGHSIYEPPPAVERFCAEYLERVGLQFGCFDFIVDSAGRHWFLECNPNGQWMWIEEETGLGISTAIAEALAAAGDSAAS